MGQELLYNYFSSEDTKEPRVFSLEKSDFQIIMIYKRKSA